MFGVMKVKLIFKPSILSVSVLSTLAIEFGMNRSQSLKVKYHGNTKHFWTCFITLNLKVLFPFFKKKKLLDSILADMFGQRHGLQYKSWCFGSSQGV